jgi:hypothetical protein
MLYLVGQAHVFSGTGRFQEAVTAYREVFRLVPEAKAYTLSVKEHCPVGLRLKTCREETAS